MNFLSNKPGLINQYIIYDKSYRETNNKNSDQIILPHPSLQHAKAKVSIKNKFTTNTKAVNIH